MSFAVCVTFHIRPDALEQFSTLMLANAKTSLEVEEGCLQFDVCSDAGNPTEIFLYELYESAAAFDVHLASDHFRTFSDATSAMVTDKQVKTYRQVNQTGG